MSQKYKYVVLNLSSNMGTRYSIFRGKTERSAINRAKDYLIDHMPRPYVRLR